ncbi:flagellar hook-length control protein FliK [Grimontia sp. NTOU-MAR1]|uniref:flagellar hook-length control protein FliK n=1 Tax=Grimontia sp. NTOU-MAR1 TaxID=3111011 RepID=UPI002DB89D03|nr:flagellar hook-length control protein FliK [Grimontia sp. NTOU-MAR1]WRV97448.1 flagellar hook-length control protein FliK [Grimontia sp. NTOU-MAR1]
MSQTSFLLSGLSSSKAPMAEGKAVTSPEVSESEGEGFFAQLAQLVSGGAEAVSDEKAVVAEGDAASEETINAALAKSLADVEGEDAEKLAADKEIFNANGEHVAAKLAIDGEADAHVAKTTKAIENGDESILNLQQVAKQDGEVLLQRLNESNQVLQTKPDEASPEFKAAQLETSKADGKSLPQQANNSEALPEEVKVAVRQPDGKTPADTKTPNLDQAAQVEVDALLSKPISMLTDDEKMVIEQLVAKVETGLLNVPRESGAAQVKTKALSDSELIAAVDALRASIAQETTNPDAPVIAAPIMGQATVATTNGDGEVMPEMMAKASQSPEWAGTKAQQEMMMRAQMVAATSTMNGEPEKALVDLQAKGLTPAAQANMSQAASAVHAAVNPQTLPSTPMSAFSAIPWTPGVMQRGSNQPQPAASQAVLEATAAQQLTETARPGTEAKADHLAQQLASSFGHQAGTTAAKLDASAVQTPLQMSQNQTEAANALSERVNMMMSKNLKHVDIRLDPPELGRLQIKLSVNNDQASVQFTVANQTARDLVEQSMPRLREMMQQQGLQLAQSSVQHQDAGGRQSFAGNQAQQGESQSGQNGQGNSSQFGRGDEQDTDHSVASQDYYVNTPKDRVDYYA